jgi:glucose-6-phosphate isomerase
MLDIREAKRYHEVTKIKEDSLMSVNYNGKHLAKFIRPEEYDAIYPQVELAHKQLADKTGCGNDFLGWLDLPVAYDKDEFARIKQAAQKIRSDSDVLLVAGIGGSYLGARAVVEACKGIYHNDTEEGVKIYFCGNSLSPTYMNDILRITKGKRFSINVISKSGTTTETALAFRILRKLLEDSVGPEEANRRIYATTDRAKGTLKQLADAQGWPTFVVPDDVGGRYSVLTAVGLLPIACAGIDIDALMTGAADARERFGKLDKENDAYRYAMTRTILYRKGKKVETVAAFEPDFTMMNEWYKQLFGESEGKDQKGLMPTSCIFSTDLHSMGQFLQDGSRVMFETYVDIKKPREDLYIDSLEGNFDGLNFLAGQGMSVVNRKAMEGTILAHNDGNVPIGVIEVDSLDAYNVGYLIYFFWKACAVSGYLLSVNPFDQPGVESYKKNMFALLGKPGYEDRKADLEAKLQ